jgi:hypothetical protein
MAKGTPLGEYGHVVNILPPTTAIAGTPYSDWFHLKEAAHASIIIQTGTVTSSSTFILYESTDSSGTTTSTIAATYKAVATAASDTFSAKAAFSTSGLTTGTTNNLTWIIDIDAGALTDGYPYLGVNFSSTAAIQISAAAILTGLRYAEDVNLSAVD